MLEDYYTLKTMAEVSAVFFLLSGIPGRLSSPPPGKHYNPYFLSPLSPPLSLFSLPYSLFPFSSLEDQPMTILMFIVSCIGGDSENRGFKFSSWVIKYILTIFHHLHLYLFNCSMCYNPHFLIFLTFVLFVCLFSTQIPQLLCLHLVQVSLLLKLSKHCFGLLVLFLLFALSLVFLTSFCYFWYCVLFWGVIRHFFKQS